ncbi:flavodoxin [Agarilytica rhodophyticola]|uniref:flavodoxin n=1 Tax=Agarilytica rhodophyticola TaxID=1737490 RepID=UPI000B345FC5|nr:flavodoxin [Agarilytica rhodophyticola]
MSKIGLFFGSDEGNTEAVAYRIQQRLGADVCDVKDIADATQLDFAEYQHIIFGIPTWDFGQIQSDWEDFWDDVSDVDFSDKTIALFGLGDQFGYGDFFLDAMGMLHDVIVAGGATIIGHWPTQGYEFDASKAKVNEQDLFVGLGIDEDQQPELTSSRLNAWCKQIHQQFGMTSSITEMDD